MYILTFETSGTDTEYIRLEKTMKLNAHVLVVKEVDLGSVAFM